MSPSSTHDAQQAVDQIDEHHVGPFLPHSSQSLFGVDNVEQSVEHYVQTNFHARVLDHLN